MSEAWRDLPGDDERALLIGAIGYRFGQSPETRLADIRAECARYARRFIRMAGITRRDRDMTIGCELGFGTRTLAQLAKNVWRRLTFPTLDWPARRNIAPICSGFFTAAMKFGRRHSPGGIHRIAGRQRFRLLDRQSLRWLCQRP